VAAGDRVGGWLGGAEFVSVVGPGGSETAAPGDDATALLPPALAPDAAPSTDGESGGADTSDAGLPWHRRRRTRRVFVEWVVLIGVALLIAFLIKTFLFQAFYIPSGSMEPTLGIGDRVLVNKLSYDFHDVHRGDIVVFHAPPSARTADIQDLVKRVIGLPGDTVTYLDGSVLINGHRLKEPYLPHGVRTTPQTPPVPDHCANPPAGQPGCVVPKGYVFVLGDNREESKDGRAFGAINQSTIVGRVFVRIWPLDNLGFL
jgi:signal peptidase I